MAETVDYFIPPEPERSSVLAGDLTPLPANVCDAFIHAYAPAGGLVWDPFCRGATVARAAMRQGRRALLSDFNPLMAFIARASLQPVTPRQLDRALETLTDAPLQQTTLEAHVSALYATTCVVCGATATVRRFTWSAEPARPTEKETVCPACHSERRDLATDEDIERVSTTEARGRAYWALLDRLGAADGALRSLADRLLDLYTARAIYALSTILNKLDVLGFDQPVLDVLMLALLDALESSIKIIVDERGQKQRAGPWRVSPGGDGDAHVTFIETNCWLAFLAACADQRARLERDANAAAYTRGFPAARSLAAADGESAAIQVRQGAAHRVATTIPDQSVDLILTTPPALDWGDMLHLSYLWTAWLLGKDEARRFSQTHLLRARRSSDWAWFFAALQRSIKAMLATLSSHGKIVFCVPVSGLTYLNVLLSAAAAAGAHIENAAFRPTATDTPRRPPALGALDGYCYLRVGRSLPSPSALPLADDAIKEAARREAGAAALALLRERGEAAAFGRVYLAIVARLSQTGLLARLATMANDVTDPWDRLRQVMQAGMAGSDELVFIPWVQPVASTSAEEPPDEDGAAPLARQRGWWWLADPRQPSAPLSDRVEWAVYTVLSTTPQASTQAVQRVVHALFPGLQTPDAELIEACVRSYAIASTATQWQLRPGEALTQRTRDHTEMLTILLHLGHRLHYKVWIGRQELRNRMYGRLLSESLSVAERYMNVEEILPDATETSQLVDVVWYQNRRASHIFEVEWTAMLGESVLRRGSRAPSLSRFVVTPPERGDLLQFKIERMPHLRRRLADDGWQFLRFDVLRDLAAAEKVTVDDLGRGRGLAPPAKHEGMQLALW